jgi:AraC-like DNA-binding protein
MEPFFTIKRGTKRRGLGLPAHAHDTAQLTFAASGIVQVHTREGRWLVPPQLAVWIPAGVKHHLELLTDAELWIINWQPLAIQEWGPGTLPDRAFALRVTPLLRSLLTAAFAAETGTQKAELAVRLMLHDLNETAHAPTFLPLPVTPAGRRVSDLAIEDPCVKLSVAELASRAGTSVRTVSRLFPTETGLTFKAWRQRARIVNAIDQLARGQTIARIASSCGFASTAAFSSAFRQVTGTTPTIFSTKMDV